jgi:hypothetical protein
MPLTPLPSTPTGPAPSYARQRLAHEAAHRRAHSRFDRSTVPRQRAERVEFAGAAGSRDERMEASIRWGEPILLISVSVLHRANCSRSCRSWVNRVVTTVRRSLPVYPDKQTFSVPVGMSQRCHFRTHAPQQTACLSEGQTPLTFRCKKIS